MRKIELLVPASSLEVLKIAVIFGADAVYIGGEAFGLRAKAKNFSHEDMKEGIAFAHEHGVKVYVTVNILAHNYDLPGVREYLTELKELKPDALIIADPGIYMYAKEICPEIERHISTQANNTNYETYRFWYNLGAKRVVTARELSLAEIKEIREHIPEDMEIETFIHGAMCISYSGRCLLSNYLAGRDANQGACTHPCRWKYSIVEEKRPGEYMPVFENERGTYIFNSKDLCMIEHIPEMIDAYPESNMFGKALPAYGFYVRHANNVKFENVKFNLTGADVRPDYVFDDVTGGEITGISPIVEGKDFQITFQNGSLNILPNVENYIKVDVIDISGKTIYSTRQNGNTTNNNINIDLPERGIYIISIQTDKGNIVRKVIYQ